MCTSFAPREVARSSRWRAVRTTLWSLGAAAFLHGARLGAQATPAHTRIITVADLTFEIISGSVIRMSSTPDTVVVGELADLTFGAGTTATGDPHTTVFFSHTLLNTGNIADSFAVSAQSRDGWPVRIYRDVNGNGLLDAGDVPVSGPIPLAANTSASLLIAVDVPAGATTRGTADTLQLVVRSEFAPGVMASVSDQLQIRSAGILVTLSESVDKTTVTPGDLVTYTINYAATGPSSATNFVLTNPLPDGIAYVPGTLRLNGHVLTDAAGDDAGLYDPVANRLQLTLATISGGDNGSVTFQVRVSP